MFYPFTASTFSTKSGTNCFKIFSIPFFRVAVELGHPEQLPVKAFLLFYVPDHIPLKKFFHHHFLLQELHIHLKYQKFSVHLLYNLC
jgi:hypothetical protein